MSWPLTGLVASKVIGSPVKRLVLLTMASRANDDGTGIFASFATMARDCELSRATVKRAIKDLEDEGLVKQVGVRPCANGKTNDYSMSVRRISALPNIKKDRGQSEPGSERTGVKAENPVHSDPGSTPEPGSERTPTRVSLTPKPIQEPIPVVAVLAPGGVSKAMIEEAQARAGKAINLTSGHVHHGGVLRQLLAVGCEWQDILDAIDAVAASLSARGKRFQSWAIIEEQATGLRDKRLAGVRESKGELNDGPRFAGAYGSGNGSAVRRQPRSAATIIMERALEDELDEAKRPPVPQ